MDHSILGDGFPVALHSNVTEPPFLAVICPLAGDIVTLGGTEIKEWLVLNIIFVRPILEK